MELYIKSTLNGVDIEQEVSLFGDEVIQLTKKWNDIQVIDGYGSFSQSFSVPIDPNNAKIFKYYDLIGGFYIQSTGFTDNSINPNYFMPARIIINEYELEGNIQITGFSTKEEQRFAYQLVFFGEEKNLIRDLNSSDFPKLNDTILSDIEFTLNKENVEATWIGTGTTHFVPIIATKNPLNFRDDKQEGNIKTGAVDTTAYTGVTGVDMENLTITYDFQKILEMIMITNGIKLSASTEVYSFLDELYIGFNTKVGYTSEDLTYVYTEAFSGNTYALSGITYNKLNMTISSLTETGIMPGNKDFVSWDNITDYATSDDTYTAQSTGDYKFIFNMKMLLELAYFNITKYRLKIVDADTDAILYSNVSSIMPRTFSATVSLTASQRVMFLVNYEFSAISFWNGKFQIAYFNSYFYDSFLSVTIKAEQIAISQYDITKTTINFPDMLISKFFTDFCKSFNIFFTYTDLLSVDKNVYRYVGQWTGGTIGTLYYKNDVVTYDNDYWVANTTHGSSISFPPGVSTKWDLTDSTILYPAATLGVCNMYFREELPAKLYDLSNYLLEDKSYTYTSDPKYKLINYKFAEGKDINNLTWQNAVNNNGYEQTGTENVTGLAYGELKTYYSYDVGIEKLEFVSPFTVFPRTTLNYTDNENYVISDTEIPIHSELNEALSGIKTDFLLMYKNTQVTGLDDYNIQSSVTDYSAITYAADYSTTGPGDYTLDYNLFPNIMKNNTTNKFRTDLEFKLTPEILYNIKVYDVIRVHNVWYEIEEMTINIKTGDAKMKLLSTVIDKGVDAIPAETTTTTTTTTPSTGCTAFSETLKWASTESVACSGPYLTQYYGNSSDFTLSTTISDSSDCVNTASIGYYSNGTDWIYSPDGSSITSGGTCDTPLAQLEINLVATTGNIMFLQFSPGDTILSLTSSFSVPTQLIDTDTYTEILIVPHTLVGNLVWVFNPPSIVTGLTDTFTATIAGVDTFVTINWTKT